MSHFSHKRFRRLVLYPSDIKIITGRSARTSRKLLQKVKIALGKEPDSFVTLKEFCSFYNLDEKEVLEYLRD